MMKMMFGRSAAAEDAAASSKRMRAAISLCMQEHSFERVRCFRFPVSSFE
jgi:hypothetical protein